MRSLAHLYSVEAFSHAMGWRKLTAIRYRSRSVQGMTDFKAAMEPRVVRL